MDWPSHTPPPIEITLLARLTLIGDLDNEKVNKQYHTHLDAYLEKGFPIYLLWPALLAAIEDARPLAVKTLLSRGMEISRMFVIQAINTKSKEVFQVLIDSGWDINEPVDTFYPPVLAELRHFVEDPDMVQWFLDRGADPDVGCYLDLTPLSFAARLASIPTFKMLLRCCWTLAHHAVEREKDAIVVLDMLAARGAPMDEPQYSNHLQSYNHEFFKGLGTPLQLAVELGKRDVVKYLLQKHHADPSIKDSKGQTPVDRARFMMFDDLVKLLEEAMVPSTDLGRAAGAAVSRL
ncbi:Ankyrin repeat [Pyrenophora seminiperda CCB06]|uniref:Ankyrin repeat n=1 Tax=Pyrenophora seminiperda CCB06 TaxID=1302712 RepID=A0A3M7MD11_9PLEO|nr:Ankyrin repeat [Pyrenophora seminiperda CCB06]